VGGNLASVWHALKNEKSSQHWETTMEYVRLGLGQDVDSVNVRLDPGGAQGALSLLWRGQEIAESAYALSDGMLSYLCFVALFRLEADASLLVFDEPETHLHPELMNRVVGFLESIATRTNVLVCTHSDRFLDALTDPVRSAALMELDGERATRIVRTTKKRLEPWLDQYRGLGKVRAEGLQSVVFEEDAT
jgi:predicted ATPase